MESESACYIKINEGFSKAREALGDGGYLLASDYFVHFKDTSKNPHLKSSHDLKKYLATAKEQGFELTFMYPTERFKNMGDWYNLPNLGLPNVNARLYELNVLISRS